MKLLTFALPVALLVTAAVAQNDPPTGTQRPDGQDPARNTDAASSESDQVIAVMVLTANSNQIALARLAGQRASSDEVKQFAQKAMQDHTDLATKLQPLAGRDAGGSRPGERVGSGERTGERGGERTGERGGERTGERGGEKNRPGGVGTGRPTDASARTNEFDHVNLIRELSAKCLETATRKLSEKSGAEFDACYMQMQVFSHTQAVDALSVYGKHVSPQLRSTLESAKSTMQTHLDHAERICKTLDKSDKNEKGTKIGSPDPAGRGR